MSAPTLSRRIWRACLEQLTCIIVCATIGLCYLIPTLLAAWLGYALLWGAAFNEHAPLPWSR